MTPLFCAIFNHDEQTVEMLCRNGANINAKIPSGTTPLMLATSKGLSNIAMILLKFKPITPCSIASGDTALHFAIRHKMTDVALQILPSFDKL